jgi:hypothetical protein
VIPTWPCCCFGCCFWSTLLYLDCASFPRASSLSQLIIQDFISRASINRKQTFNMTTTVSTTVKIVVSMLVMAALVATTFNSTVRSTLKECHYPHVKKDGLRSSAATANLFCCNPYGNQVDLTLFLVLHISDLKRSQGNEKASVSIRRYLPCYHHQR